MECEKRAPSVGTLAGWWGCIDEVAGHCTSFATLLLERRRLKKADAKLNIRLASFI